MIVIYYDWRIQLLWWIFVIPILLDSCHLLDLRTLFLLSDDVPVIINSL